MTLAIVIPTFNEDKTIKKIILECLLHGDVIVVNDNSQDLSKIIAEKYATCVINHPKNLGYDCALETGIREAIDKNYDYVLTIDADGEHPTDVIDDMKLLSKKGFEIIIGNRSTKNRFIEIIFAVFAKLLWSIKDPLCGMKMYKIETIKKLNYLNTYNSIGTEIMFRSIKNGAKHISLDIGVSKRLGRSRIGGSVMLNLIIIKSIFKSLLIKLF